MTSRRPSPGRAMLIGLTLIAAGGCRLTPPAEPAPLAAAPKSSPSSLRPYVPASRPADPVVEALPTKPRDARPAVPLRYTVELWEILLPRDSVTTDEAFWKRVDEPVGTDGQQLLRNGFRTGQLPMNDLETVRKLIEDRGGSHTTYTGVNGRLIEIPVTENVPEQTLFYFNRDSDLVGRTWEKCNNFFYFSFETTPRNPDRLRVSLTPGVRSTERKLQYALVAGRDDRELKYVTDQSQYDVTVSADLSLDRLLVIAPSAEARQMNTLGGAFLMADSKSQKQERLILLIPHAFTVGEATPPQ